MIDTRWIDLAQFIENKGDCLFFYKMKNIHGGLTTSPRSPAEKINAWKFCTRLHYHWKINLMITKCHELKVLRIYTELVSDTYPIPT